MKLWELLSEEGKIVQGVNTTCDVGLNQTSIEAAKFGNTVDENGRPPLIIDYPKGTKAKDTVKRSEFYGENGSSLKESTLDEINQTGSLPFSNSSNQESVNLRIKEYGRGKAVGEFRGFKLYSNETPIGQKPQTYIHIFDEHNMAVGAARLDRKEQNMISVGHIWINPKYQKQGFGFDFYAWLLNQGFTIQSDINHTHASEALWKKLARAYKARIMVNGEIGPQVYDTSQAYESPGATIILTKS